jgi:hypothetical protein
MTNNKKIVLVSITLIVAAGLLALNPSMMVGNAQAQLYANEYGHDNNYYQDDNRYSYDKKDPKSSHVDIQKIKCVNSNINVNGIDVTQIPRDTTALAAANGAGGEGAAEGANTQNGNGLADRINFDRNLVNICVNVNANEQVKVSTPEEEPGPCETCFTTHLTPTQQQFVLANAEQGDTFAEICGFLDRNDNNPEESDIVFNDIASIPGITETQQNALFNCLVRSGVVDPRVA